MREINNYIEEYARHSFEDVQVKYRRRKVLEQIRKYSHKNILEIGCGFEPIFQFLEDFATMTVIEPGYDFFANAQKLACDNKKIRCIQEFFCKEILTELTNQSYDFILVSSLLHELENPVEFLEALKEICSPETIIHINVPNANSIHRILAKEMGLIKNETEKSEANIKLQQHSVFSMESLVELVRNQLFQIVDKGSYFIKPFAHYQMQQLLDANIVDFTVLDGLYNLTKYIPEFGSEIFVDCKLSK